jgi:hypothetical protein
VVGVPLDAAGRAPLVVAAQGGGAAMGDRPHGRALGRREGMRPLVRLYLAAVRRRAVSLLRQDKTL